MAGGIPTNGFASRRAYCLAMWSHGWAIRKIAREGRIPEATVRALIHSGKKHNSYQDRYVTAQAELAMHAKKRGWTIMQMERELIITIAENDLVDAVLDDGED